MNTLLTETWNKTKNPGWIYSPICDCGTMVLCLSQSGEYSSPSSFSLSPWTKNSSIHRAVQRWWSPQRLAGCDTSQECSIRQRTFVLSKLKFNQIDTKNKTLGMHGTFQTMYAPIFMCIQCTLDLVKLLASEKPVTQSHNVTKFTDFLW